MGAALGAMGSRIVAAQVFLHSESPAALQIVARLSLEEQSEFLRTLANSGRPTAALKPTTVIHHQQQLLRASEDPMSAPAEAASYQILSEGWPERRSVASHPQEMRASGVPRSCGEHHPVGDAESSPIRLSFNPQLRVEFRGATVTSDAGLLLPRELDKRLGLDALIERHLADPSRSRCARSEDRHGHGLADAVRVCPRLVSVPWRSKGICRLPSSTFSSSRTTAPTGTPRPKLLRSFTRMRAT